MSSYDISARNEYLKVGLAVSVLLHFFLVYQIYQSFNSKPKIVPRKVYSVTLDSSFKKGGLQQLKDPKAKKSQIAPPKKVAAITEVEELAKKQEKEKVIIPEKKPEVKKEVVKPTPKPVKKAEKVVVKETPKPTPKATPQATPVKKVEATPEPTPVKKEEVKPQATPAKKEQPKPKAAPKKVTKKPVEKKANYQDALQKYLGASTDAGGSGFGSAGTGGTGGTGGGEVRSPEWFRYIDLLKYEIKKSWNWHDNAANLVTEISIKLESDGTLSSVRVHKSSGNRLFDDSALRATRKSSPVPPPSAALYGKYRSDFTLMIVDFRPGSF